MKLREAYAERGCIAKRYEDLKEFFFKEKEVAFSTRDDYEKIKKQFNSKKTDVGKVWLLFAGNDKNNWECLQVGHSKNGVRKEINDIIDFIFCKHVQKSEGITFTDSAFYENVCPKIPNCDYRKLLYSKIGSDYKYFRICFLNVDKYLGIEADNDVKKSDAERIVEICKNQYAEAKIAYQTLAIYWRLYSSGIDGQTIAYITEHIFEFK